LFFAAGFLGVELSLTPDQLSEMLNGDLGMGFRPCINRFRIEAARELSIRLRCSLGVETSLAEGKEALISAARSVLATKPVACYIISSMLLMQ